jgi:hypothetical protein
MRNILYRHLLPSLLLVTTPALALASPLILKAAGGESQTVIMCPDCSRPIACAKVGDYTVAASAEMPHKNMPIVHFYIGLTDRDGKAVTNAKVAVVLSMPGHQHPARTFQAKGGKHGQYEAVAELELHMVGAWKADVQITTPKGDVVTQPFTFSS